MAWISLDDATSAGKTTASDIVDWLDSGYSDQIKTSHASAFVVLFAGATQKLSQVVVSDTVQYRGLDEDLATFIADGLNSDNTRRVPYYKMDGSDCLVAEATLGPSGTTSVTVSYMSGTTIRTTNVSFPTPGVTVAARAARANEAGGWTVTVESATYYAPYAWEAANTIWSSYSAYTSYINAAWSQSVPSAATSGIETARSASRTFVFNFSGNVLYQTESTVVTEYRFIATANVASIVSSNTADASWISKSKTVSGVTCVRYVRDGTQKTASARWVDSLNLWTVTVTATTYGNTGW